MDDLQYGLDSLSEWIERHDPALPPDQLLPTDNPLEIPTLRLDRQPRGAEMPWRLYGELRRHIDMDGAGTLHFYTDDRRYGDLYLTPGKLLNIHPACVVEPNYSLFNETPVAFGLQQIYKKRWLARVAQDAGIRAFVDLNVAVKWYAYNLLGVPKGWRSFCTRGYASRPAALDYEWRLATRVAGTDDILFVVYNGGDTARKFCQERGCVYVSPLVTLKRRAAAARDTYQHVALPISAFLTRGSPAEQEAEWIRRMQVERLDNRQDNEEKEQ